MKELQITDHIMTINKEDNVKEDLIKELRDTQRFFETSTHCLSEKDSTFAPKEGMYSVVAHVAHAAQSVDWFIDGMFNPEGFDLDFEQHIRKAMACKSLDDARKWFKRAVSNAIDIIGSKTEAELQAALPDGPIMGGSPRFLVIGALSEHTAHHRGALTVYSRLLGKKPKMPYGQM